MIALLAMIALPALTSDAVAGPTAQARADTAGASQGSDAAQEERTLARYGDLEITMDDIVEQIGDDLARLEFQYRQQRHQAIESTMLQLLRRELLADEAERQGITPDALVKQIVAEAEQVTSSDVESFYQQNRQQMQGQSLEQVRPAIRQYLNQQAQQRALNEYTDDLAEEAGAEILLEPFRADLDNEGAPARGPADAPVTLVEFSDFECPFCQQLTTEVLPRLRQEFGDQIRVVYRHFPLEEQHPHAAKAAEAAICAQEQGQFWEMHDLLFAEQDSLTVTDLNEKAERIGLDSEAFAACLESGRHADRMAADKAAGARVNVTGTPAVFVNGRPVQGGAAPFEVLSEMIEEELERSATR